MTPSRRADDSPAASPLNAESLRPWALPLDPTAGKLERGTVLVVGGSLRTGGAVVLAGVAALRVGAGRLQIATVESVSPSLGVVVPEALVEGLPATHSGAIDPAKVGIRLDEQLSAAQAVLIGPGLDDLDATTRLLAEVIPRIGRNAIVVIDALALLSMTRVPEGVLSRVRGRLVLTPNRQEAEDLLPARSPRADAWTISCRAAERYDAAVTMEGHVVAPDGRRWRSKERLPGLGTSGSGDVLAGLVAGGAARCGDAAQAACWGTYLHVAAASAVARQVGDVGFLARELLDPVPRILVDVVGSAE